MFKAHQICVVIISYLKLLNAGGEFLGPLTSSAYKQSTVSLPAGFDSESPPRRPMLYPFAVSLSEVLTRPSYKGVPSTTPGWIPLSAYAKKGLAVTPTTLSSTTLSGLYPVAVLEERISHDSNYSPSSYNNGPVFESIVYGTWKPNPPLQPANILNDKKLQQHKNSANISNSSSIISGSNTGIFAEEKVYNKTINRQHGGFIGFIQQKHIKADKQNPQKYNHKISSPTLSSIEYRSRGSAEISSEEMQRKIKKQGRQKIHPITSTTEQVHFKIVVNTEQTTTTITENTTHQENFLKVNSTDHVLTEAAKQINESTDIKYNLKQASLNSIDMNTMMTTSDSSNDDDNDDEKGVLKMQSVTTPTVSSNGELQQSDDDDDNISVTIKSWPTDFMGSSLSPTSNANIQRSSDSGLLSTLSNANIEAVSSEILLSFNALNIPPSLWPKLPGNITKIGKPFAAKNSAEEPALCVSLTVREQNMINSNEFVDIERIFCFPMPTSTTSKSNLSATTNTTRPATRSKGQNFSDFVDSNVANKFKNNFKFQLYLVVLILVIDF